MIAKSCQSHVANNIKMNDLITKVESRIKMLNKINDTIIGLIMRNTLNEMLNSYISLMIFALLERETNSGYQIIKKIKYLTNGAIALKDIHYYLLLSKLLSQEKIRISWEEIDMGCRRCYYYITEKGIRELNTSTEFRLICRAFWNGINTPVLNFNL